MDCLKVLNDENAIPSGSIDLIYLDPPFNSKSNYTFPFKGKYKKVEAFKDTWKWGLEEEERLDKLENEGVEDSKNVADVINLARRIVDSGRGGVSLSAYLVNMAVRLISMKRVLKDTGSIWLHCDPTASHYLKLIMDTIFGAKGNFRNEVIWCYTGPGSPGMRQFNRKHDVLFWYSKNNEWTFNKDMVRIPHADGGPHIGGYGITPDMAEDYGKRGKVPETWWQFAIAPRSSKEYLGYPTQKPLKLLKRIITACSNEGDLVLDPFCGCGTTVHAAEELKRRWIGIDISRFSAGLVHDRIRNNFKEVVRDIEIIGNPRNIQEARKLAKENPFEFEKWVCGEIGAHGMYHRPGKRGADGGVDGVIQFVLFKGLDSKEIKKTYAIVQVKSGQVKPNDVRALATTVKEKNATAGVFVCFEKYMKTVNNNKAVGFFQDSFGKYPMIQGFSIEQLLNNEKPKLPQLTYNEEAKTKGHLF